MYGNNMTAFNSTNYKRFQLYLNNDACAFAVTSIVLTKIYNCVLITNR